MVPGSVSITAAIVGTAEGGLHGGTVPRAGLDLRGKCRDRCGA
jgi:hypothetical protein